MPPDTAQERTEAPTQRRREEARKRGQVGKSSDLTSAVVLMGTLLTLEFMGHHLFGRLLDITRHCLGDTGPGLVNADQMATTLTAVLRTGALVVLPVILVVLVLATVASFFQVGVLFTIEPIKPSFEKLNPISGLKRMFSARAFVHLAMGIAKTIALALVAYWTLRGRIDMLAYASTFSYLAIIGMASELLFTLGVRLALVLLLLAIIDFVYQRWKHERDLRMTKEEIKEELKRMDGDPKLKQRRRQIQMQLAVQRIKAAVPKADVVVTNPTEIAVAIQYNAETMNAPKLTAKGADFLAQKIREIAIEHGIPIVERKPLARAIYKNVEVGQEIPAEFYKAVAEVLAYVYELAGRGYRRQPAAGVAFN